MAPSRIPNGSLLFAALWCIGGCQMIDRGDESYVTGLRILAVKAEPPEVAPGQTSTLTALAVDTQNRPLTINWSYCEDPPPDGENFNTDCVTSATASFIYPFGSGLSAMLVMPQVTDPTVLGRPDQTNGVYLPVRATVTAGTDTVTAIYSLRVNMTMGTAENNNPVFTGLFKVMAGAGMPVDGGQMDGSTFSVGTELETAVDPATPLVVHAMDKITLRALFTAASAESYTRPGRTTDAGTSMPRMTSETLDQTMFTTGGTVGQTRASNGTMGNSDMMRGGFGGGGPGGGGGGQEWTITMDNNLPATGGTIDVWVVGRDSRGGLDYLHRSLSLQ